MIPGEYLLDFRKTLYAGGYNLLLGSGVSLGSSNGSGRAIMGAEALRHRLCSMKSLPDRTPLARVASVLDPNQIRDEAVKRFL